MSERNTLIAFIATLSAIILLALMATAAMMFDRSIEALGIGGAITGLIGVLGTFKPRTTNPDPVIDDNAAQ